MKGDGGDGEIKGGVKGDGGGRGGQKKRRGTAITEESR